MDSAWWRSRSTARREQAVEDPSDSGVIGRVEEQQGVDVAGGGQLIA